MDLETFIGIDVSKETLDVACYREQKETIMGKFKNDKGGFRKIMHWIKSQTGSSSQQWLICFEHTGVYSWPLSCFLSEKRIGYSIQPALQIKRSMGIQRGKNDRTDARMIAKFAYLYRKEIKLTTLPSKGLISLRNLLSYRERLVKSKVSIQIAAKELAAHTTKDLHSFIVKDSAQLVKALASSIREVDKQIECIIKRDSQLNHLFHLSTSVTGIGLQVAANMLVYTEGFTKFDSWRKFSCYCGLAPFEHQSGTSIRGKTRTSPLGNKKMKAMIGNGVASAIQWDPELSNYYNRKLKQGKPKMIVQTAIKNKLLSRVFATVKRGTPFVPLFNFAKA